MVSTDLETIPVNQLELGMTIHAIGEQAGKLAVKSKGKVSHLSVIEQLSSNGVVSVIIEKASLGHSNVLQRLTQQKQRLHAGKQRRSLLPMSLLSKSVSQQSLSPQFLSPQSVSPQALSTVSSKTQTAIDFEFASQLITHSYKVHKSFVDRIKRDLALDIQPLKTMVSDIYDSVSTNPSALLSLSMLMKSNDYLANHAIHVAALMCFFAKNMNMSSVECKRLTTLGYLFDIGMVKIPKEIVNKPGELTNDEQLIMQEHVAHSLKLVAPLHLDNDIMLAIEQHHERLGVTGYPNGYSGSKIHKFSRMLAIVDCYDALTTEQAHHVAQSPASALKHLSQVEHGYDAKLVLKFIRALGVYPVGSLVALSNKRIGIVTKNNLGMHNAPVVNVFYSVSAGQYVSPHKINLATPHNNLKVLKPMQAQQYNLNVDKGLLYK
jgi:HD-GYP domain-containing protein (c-di-GMP phosphodiesterase class II)